MRGLCLNYHHSYPQEVGSRRFRAIRKEFTNLGIHLDILACRSKHPQVEERVYAAGKFSPVSGVLHLAANLKQFVRGDSGASSEAGALQSADFETLGSKTHSADRSLRSLLLSIEMLPDPDAGWILPAVRRGLNMHGKYDFVISTAPPWSSHIAAAWLGRLRGLPVILDDRDPWADSPGRMLLITHPAIRHWDARLAARTYRRAAAIVAVTEPARRRHAEQAQSHQRVALIPNGYDPSLEKLYRPPERKEKLNITYVGSFYHGRSPLLVLKPALKLPADIAADLHFHFIGPLTEQETAEISNLNGAFEVTLYGPQSHEYCLDAIVRTDCCLLLAIGQPSQIPAKVYEYIGLGRPVLSISEQDDATMQLLQGRQWAWAKARNDEPGILAALSEMHTSWRNDAMPQLDCDGERREFSFATLAGKYAQLIRQIVGK